MKRILSILLVVLAFSSVKAQQDPQFTQWFNDKLSFNPAVAGLNDAHCFSLFYRNQWSGFTAPSAGGGEVAVNPKTFMFNYSGYFGNGIGAGLNFYNDQLGNETNNVVKLSGAYHLPLNSGPKLSFGLSLGLYQKALGDNWIFIDEDDPSIPNQGPSQGTFDLGLGVYLYDTDYYVGLSSTHLTAADLDQLGISVARHYFFMGGYNFDLPSGGVSMKLRTNLLAKSDFNKTALDVNANVLFNDMFY
ncbi:MAG: PorP/SprF family type IX secretion system membrane protein, partial [Flavobacteriales bacterium]